MALNDWISKSAKPATPATHATHPGKTTTKPPARPSSAASVATVAATHETEYTLADLAEMDKLLRELATMEGWSEEDLADLLDQRQRMAPVNVRAMLLAVRRAHADSLAVWPDVPASRPKIRLCVLTVIDGGKRDSKPARPTKSLDPEPEAA